MTRRSDCEKCKGTGKVAVRIPPTFQSLYEFEPRDLTRNRRDEAPLIPKFFDIRDCDCEEIRFWVWRDGPGAVAAFDAEFPVGKSGDPLALGEPIFYGTKDEIKRKFAGEVIMFALTPRQTTH